MIRNTEMVKIRQCISKKALCLNLSTKNKYCNIYTLSSDCGNIVTFISLQLIIIIFCVSPVGNGRSQGDRVYVETFNTYVQDVVRHVEDMKAQYPGVPSMLMGHSMVSVPCSNVSCSKMQYVIFIVLLTARHVNF